MSGSPRVDVLLLNWQGWRDTIECLESVFRQRYDNYRVIVCDNDSPDDSVDRIRAWAAGEERATAPEGHPLAGLSQPPVAKPVALREYDRGEAERGGDGTDAPLTIIRTGGNYGFAGGNNVGLRYILARGDTDFVWLLNNDTVVAPDALQRMVARAQADPGVAVTGSKLLYYDEPARVQAVGGGRLTAWQGLATHVGADAPDDERWSEPLELDVVLGASFLVRRRVIEEVGLLDEDYFMYAEEMDWCARMRRQGWKLMYAPGSVVWHKVGRSAGQQSPFQDYHSALGTLLFVRKNFPRLGAVAAAYGLYRMLLPKVVRLQPARAAAVLRAYRDFLGRSRMAKAPGT